MSFILGVFLHLIYHNVIFILSGAAVLLTLISIISIEFSKPVDYDNLATSIMISIMEDKGAFDGKRSVMFDDQKHNCIMNSMKHFFKLNPKLPVEETMRKILSGIDGNDVRILYGHMQGFTVLITDINMFKYDQ